jgi:polyhydroxybutyrate depolymerase
MTNIHLGLLLLIALSPADAKRETFALEGGERQAIVYSNSRSAPSIPVVFVFHGHGGTAQNAARRFRLHELWPEAVVVYMQGLPGVAGITDPDGLRSGWQKSPGEVGDRDVKFFDAALERIKKTYKTDPSRVYLLGHSNGSRFANVLWNMRGDRLTAICSSSGQGGRLIIGARPKPVFIIAGEKDPLVPYEGQKQSIELVRRLLKVDPSRSKVEGLIRTEPGTEGTELVTYIHPGGHQFPTEALPFVVSFFKRHPK